MGKNNFNYKKGLNSKSKNSMQKKAATSLLALTLVASPYTVDLDSVNVDQNTADASSFLSGLNVPTASDILSRVSGLVPTAPATTTAPAAETQTTTTPAQTTTAPAVTTQPALTAPAADTNTAATAEPVIPGLNMDVPTSANDVIAITNEMYKDGTFLPGDGVTVIKDLGLTAEYKNGKLVLTGTASHAVATNYNGYYYAEFQLPEELSSIFAKSDLRDNVQINYSVDDFLKGANKGTVADGELKIDAANNIIQGAVKLSANGVSIKATDVYTLTIDLAGLGYSELPCAPDQSLDSKFGVSYVGGKYDSSHKILTNVEILGDDYAEASIKVNACTVDKEDPKSEVVVPPTNPSDPAKPADPAAPAEKNETIADVFKLPQTSNNIMLLLLAGVGAVGAAIFTKLLSRREN